MIWANEKLRGNPVISTFRDEQLSDGVAILSLIDSIDSKLVDWKLVLRDGSQESKELNAKYIISLSRALGASIFLTWEDVVEVQPKMMLILLSTLMTLSYTDCSIS